MPGLLTLAIAALPGRFGFLFPPDARLLVVLPFADFPQNASSLAGALKTTQGPVEALVFPTLTSDNPSPSPRCKNIWPPMG